MVVFPGPTSKTTHPPTGFNARSSRAVAVEALQVCHGGAHQLHQPQASSPLGSLLLLFLGGEVLVCEYIYILYIYDIYIYIYYIVFLFVLLGEVLVCRYYICSVFGIFGKVLVCIIYI